MRKDLGQGRREEGARAPSNPPRMRPLTTLGLALCLLGGSATPGGPAWASPPQAPAPRAPAVGQAPAPGPGQALQEALQLRAASRRPEAIERLQAALARSPGSARLLHLLGVLEFEIGEGARAVESLARSLDEDPSLAGVRSSLAAAVGREVYRAADHGRFEEAEALLTAHRARLADPASLAYLEGVVCLERWRRRGDGADHRRWLEAWARARALEPVSAAAELLAGLQAWARQGPGRADEALQRALTLRPGNRYALLWLGAAQAARGQAEAARQTWSRARPLFHRPDLLQRLEADLALQEALDTEDPQRRLSAQARAEAGYRGDEAELEPSPGRSRALTRLLIWQERWQEALLGTRSLTDREPAEAEDLLEAGRLYRALGLLEEARAAFARASAAAIGTLPPRQRRLQAEAALGEALALAEQGRGVEALALDGPFTAGRSPRATLDQELLRGLTRPGPDGEEVLARLAAPDSPLSSADRSLAWATLAARVEERDRLEALERLARAWAWAPPGSPRSEALQARFEALSAEEREAIARWRAHNGLVFLVDLATGGSRQRQLRTRTERLERITLEEGGRRFVAERPPAPSLVPEEIRGEAGRRLVEILRRGVDRSGENSPDQHTDPEASRWETGKRWA